MPCLQDPVDPPAKTPRTYTEEPTTYTVANIFPDGVTINDRSLWLFGNWSEAAGLVTDHNKTIDANYTATSEYAASLARYGFFFRMFARHGIQGTCAL
jgi:hypothetical protein